MKKFLPALLLALLLINCQTQNLSLTDSEWRLITLNNTDYTTVEPSITLTFTGDNKVAGHAGCNRYFGSCTLSDSAINFENMGATKMYCDGKMEIEDTFLKALSEVNSYSLSAKKLYLKAGEATVLEFTR